MGTGVSFSGKVEETFPQRTWRVQRRAEKIEEGGGGVGPRL